MVLVLMIQVGLKHVMKHNVKVCQVLMMCQDLHPMILVGLKHAMSHAITLARRNLTQVSSIPLKLRN